MGYDVVPTATFASEYERIIGYLVNDLGSKAAARGLVDGLSNVRVSLEDNPLLHAVSRKPRLNDLELREVLVGSYAVVYRIADTTVYLEHIFHQSQDFERHV